jgi:hypothetical protein
LYKNQEAETEVIQYYKWLQSWYAKHTLRWGTPKTVPALRG